MFVFLSDNDKIPKMRALLAAAARATAQRRLASSGSHVEGPRGSFAGLSGFVNYRQVIIQVRCLFGE